MLEMHEHPKGNYKDKVHVYVSGIDCKDSPLNAT